MKETHQKILEFIYLNPNKKAYVIARATGLTKKHVNQIVYREIDGYVNRNRNYEWNILSERIKGELAIKLKGQTINSKPKDPCPKYLKYTYKKAYKKQMERIKIAQGLNALGQLEEHHIEYLKVVDKGLKKLKMQLDKANINFLKLRA